MRNPTRRFIRRLNQRYAVVIHDSRLYILSESPSGPELLSKDVFLSRIGKDNTQVSTRRGPRQYRTALHWLASPDRRQYAERTAINAPMQGTAADLIKLSMNKVQQVLDDEKRMTKMIMQVHDELVFEVPASEVEWVKTEIPRLMASVADLKVPLLAEIGVGENWEKAH